MSMTIKDIARKANVAVSTVSRALNNRFDINQETRVKILRIVEECGYNPNSVARGLVMQKVFTIGLLIPDISNPFFADVAAGVEAKARENGYSVIFCNSNNDPQNEKTLLEIMKGRSVDGMIVSLSDESKDELNDLAGKKYPVVQIDRKIRGVKCPGVFIDNVRSVYKASKYLIDMGHRRFAYFTGDMNSSTARERLQGFRKAIREAGIHKKEIFIDKGEYSVDSGKFSMRRMLESGFRPTALVAASDLQAAGALYVALRAGIKVPEELSIIGHDDIDLSYLVNPNITTMEQPKKELGFLAADLLFRLIDRKNGAETKSIILDTKMVLRESTAKPCTGA